MPDLKEQARVELFNKIRDAISSLESGPLDDLSRTEVIFDVLEQLMARCIAASSTTQENLEDLTDQVAENLEAMALGFLAEEFPNNEPPNN